MPRKKTVPPVAVASKLRAEKKTVAKTIRPKKSTKSVLIDVIDDEELAQPAWPEYRLDKIEEKAGKRRPDRTNNARDLNEEIDNQKKYFSTLSRKLSVDYKKRSGKDSFKSEIESDLVTKPRSVGLYRRLVIKFVIIVLILAAVVFYFSFSKLNVQITLKGENISDTILFKMTDASAALATTSAVSSLLNDPREEIKGVVKETNALVTKTYPASGETYLGEEIVGQVRLINNSPKSQALVATTRLLSPDNKLYRIKNAVNIPENGEIVADIYTDKPTVDMAIAPTTFTIPGLWLGLQDKIYAQSDSAFVFSKHVQRYVTAADLELAAKDINVALVDEAKKKANIGDTSGDWLYLMTGPVTVTTSAKVGDKKAEFTASASGQIVSASSFKAEMAKLAAAKLNLIIPDNKELSEFKPESITYTFDNYDAASQTATIKANFNGTMILKSNSEVVNPEQLVNLSAEQIGTYLRDQAEIKDYKLKFSPAFIKKAPSLVDRIKIEVKTE